MYFKIQPHYPTFLHLTDRSGRLTYWEIIGKMDPSALKNAGITVNDIRANYIWQTLFTWDVWLQRDDVQEGTVIVDLEGFRFSQVTLFVVQMFAKTSSIIQRHFPDRDHVLIVINAPEWWGRVYDLFSPLFPEKQRRKLRVSVGQQASMQTLREYIDPKNPGLNCFSHFIFAWGKKHHALPCCFFGFSEKDKLPTSLWVAHRLPKRRSLPSGICRRSTGAPAAPWAPRPPTRRGAGAPRRARHPRRG